MSATLPAGFEIKGGELTITRMYNAPRPLVFAAHTEAEHLKRWWGPYEYPVAVCTVDLRPGGKWHYCMKSRSTGDEAWGIAIYTEVEPPARLAFTDAFSDAEGNINEALPVSTITFKFEEAGNQTRVVMTSQYPNEEALKKVLEFGMVQGITEAMEQLDALLAELQTA